MVVDANVATYWLVPSPFSNAAARIASRTDLCAPAFLKVETTNALLKYVNAGFIGPGHLRDALDVLDAAIADYVEDSRLLKAAADIALAHRHTIYDGLYLALARERDEPVATADRRMAAIAASMGIDALLIEAA